MPTTPSRAKFVPPFSAGRLSDYDLAERYGMLSHMSDELRDLIDRAGGLLTKAELAKRWGVSRQRMNELVAMPDFPQPVNPGSRYKLYAALECDAWREIERRPGPKPRP